MKIPIFNGGMVEIPDGTIAYTESLLALPALIDPHVHFRTPGHEYKENWESGALAALAGGVTTVLDMPNTYPATVDTETLELKKKLIDEQLAHVGISLRYGLYIGATGSNAHEIEQNKHRIVAVKLFMGQSTGNLMVDTLARQEEIFRACAESGVVLAVHAEDEGQIQSQKSKIKSPTLFDHSYIRAREAAVKAMTTAIDLAKKYGTRVYFCHISTREEAELIRWAKTEGVRVYAEVTPHHLFLTASAYDTLGTKAQMNPPLRTQEDIDALWEGLNDGTIDTVGSDHAPHTLEEKAKIYPASPSGVPGIETILPLLLNAYYEGKISLEKIVAVTRTNAQKIFSLPDNDDWVIVDLEEERIVENKHLKTKCGWSPFEGWKLKGWLVYTEMQNATRLPERQELKTQNFLSHSQNMRHVISLKEQSREDILEILELARKIKAKYKAGEVTNYLENRSLIMFFQKTSTRTRLSFEAGMTELGGHAIFLDARTTQFSLTDFSDEIKAVMRYGDILMFRALKAEDVIRASLFNQIPVIDACSEKYHPCQALGDLLTMAEYAGGVQNIKKVTWLGIENNVSNTLKLACAKLGITVAIAAPEANPASIDAELNAVASASGRVYKTLDVADALRDSQFVHTDTWMDMEFFQDGKVRPEFMQEYERRKRVFMPYQLNAGLIDTFAPQAKNMHCMPCHIGYEITRDAIDHPNSIIFDQAENRKHIQKAIMLWVLGKY